MEISLKNKVILIKHHLKSNETYRITKSSKFETLTIFKKPQLVKGMSNSTEDFKMVIFADYDNVYRRMVIEDFMIIQKKFSLPPGYLFSTEETTELGEHKGNYHLINLKKVDYDNFIEILKYLRCDSNYKTMNNRNPYRNFVLRLGKKSGKNRPRFIGLIGDNINLNKEVSKPHREILNKLYPKINHPRYTKLDSCKKVFLQEYEAS